jgi:hypothetical protein
LDAFGSGNPGTGMDLDHVKRLVEWKLYVSNLSHLVDVMQLVSTRTPWRADGDAKPRIPHRWYRA